MAFDKIVDDSALTFVPEAKAVDLITWADAELQHLGTVMELLSQTQGDVGLTAFTALRTIKAVQEATNQALNALKCTTQGEQHA